jgi:hypothetical protein
MFLYCDNSTIALFLSSLEILFINLLTVSGVCFCQLQYFDWKFFVCLSVRLILSSETHIVCLDKFSHHCCCGVDCCSMTSTVHCGQYKLIYSFIFVSISFILLSISCNLVSNCLICVSFSVGVNLNCVNCDSMFCFSSYNSLALFSCFWMSAVSFFIATLSSLVNHLEVAQASAISSSSSTHHLCADSKNSSKSSKFSASCANSFSAVFLLCVSIHHLVHHRSHRNCIIKYVSENICHNSSAVALSLQP